MLPIVSRRLAGACLVLIMVAIVQLPGALAQDTLVREGISQDEAVAIVRAQTKGKVVRVNSKIEGGAMVYQVRVLTPDGRLREYRVDAATGAIR